MHKFVIGTMENTYPHEMDNMPNTAESMRRGKILAAYNRGAPKPYADEIDERVRRALMYHQALMVGCSAFS
jgi:hypothetical protein